MKALSWSGYLPQIVGEIGAIILFLFFARRKLEAAVLTLSTLGIAFDGLALKKWVNRPRPTADLIRVDYPELDQGRLSFTAGHVQAYVSVLGFLSFLISIEANPAAWQKALVQLCAVLIALIGPSRLYEGCHWLSDIIGGYLFGLIWLIIGLRLYALGVRHDANERLNAFFARLEVRG